VSYCYVSNIVTQFSHLCPGHEIYSHGSFASAGTLLRSQIDEQSPVRNTPGIFYFPDCMFFLSPFFAISICFVMSFSLCFMSSTFVGPSSFNPTSPTGPFGSPVHCVVSPLTFLRTYLVHQLHRCAPGQDQMVASTHPYHITSLLLPG